MLRNQKSALHRTGALLLLLLSGSLACVLDPYNAGDPASEEYLRTQVLQCLLSGNCIPDPTRYLRIAPSNSGMCALHKDGRVRCWGANNNGQLGYDHTTTVGNGIGPTIQEAGDVNLGGPAIRITGGTAHTCALLLGGTVRCWGQGSAGQLGYGNTQNVGDGVGPSITTAGDVPVGGPVIDISAGANHTCAVLVGGTVRCWGSGTHGMLGYGNTQNVGDGVGPSITSAGDVPLGGTAVQVSVGNVHTCARLSSGAVRCWGRGHVGQLGYGNTSNVGDGVGVSVSSAGDVPVGGTVTDIQAANNFTCATLQGGTLRCWGNGAAGRLGYDSTANIGDGGGLSIAAAGDLTLGGLVLEQSSGSTFSLVKIDSGGVRAWGQNSDGRLGYGNTQIVGDGIGPSIVTAGDLSLGAPAMHVFAGFRSGCVSISETSAVCFGRNTDGDLGINSTANVGDNEVPSASSVTRIF